MEQSLLAAALRSREDFDLIKSYINLKLSTYSKQFQVVMKKVGEYYARDGNAQSVLPEVLVAQLQETIRNEKHIAMFSEFIAESVAQQSSDANVRAVVLLAKQQEVGDQLTQALATSVGEEKIDSLIKELQDLRAMTSIDQLADHGLEIYDQIDLSALMSVEYDPDNLIKIYPQSLNDRLDGGAKKGHHVVVYGRPESMKTGLCINAHCGFGRQGKRSIYFINEDRPQDVILRKVSNLSGMTKRQIQQNPRRAEELAKANGFDNLIVVSCSPGTPAQIEKYIEQYEPDCIIIDQLRNLQVKAETRTNQLEYAATQARTIGKKWNVLVLSVTQAGDSGSNKAVLEMGDIDSSNTGIPAQADVLIGVGVDATLEAERRRVLSLPKNKISGLHESFPVNVIPELSRVSSV